MRGKHLIALAATVTICCSAAPAETVVRETGFGAFTLVQETRTPDPGEPPIMHVATAWTKLHLRWRSKTGDMMVEIIDDGGKLEIDTEGHGCLSATRYLLYGKRLAEPALWSDIRQALAGIMEVCPRIEPGQREAYAAEFARAHDDYIAGIEAMKRRAVKLFGPSLKRCPPPKDNMPGPFGMCLDEYR